MQPESLSILVVDDDATLRERMARAFRERGYDVKTAGNYDEAMKLAREDSPEYALVDLKMPGASGLDLVRDLKELDPSTQIVVLTGYGSIATAVQAMKLGATSYLSKPADIDDILGAFRGQMPQQDAAPSLARAEWEHIQRILTDCDENISEAARRLGIHRRSLQRKLQKNPPR